MSYLRIIMDGTLRGSDDGHTVRQFIEGNVYETDGEGEHYISHSQAAAFIKSGWARLHAQEAL